MGELRIVRFRFSTFAVGDDVIHGAVIERMDFIVTEPAYRGRVKEVLSERELKESGLNNGSLDDRIDKGTEFGPPEFRLNRTAGAFGDRILHLCIRQHREQK